MRLSEWGSSEKDYPIWYLLKENTMNRKDTIVKEIAKKHLLIPSLEVRNRDALDFHDVHVIGVKLALEAAYEAGKKDSIR
jgi:nickel-dependent lactate racemase